MQLIFLCLYNHKSYAPIYFRSLLYRPYLFTFSLLNTSSDADSFQSDYLFGIRRHFLLKFPHQEYSA